ncbi:MAG: hypothetical protein EOP49_33145 [Sphingobacteriales bacterium]|nr:MAG: hypothetical protein EOP49_33145 [Sphingobacteriales bacterium]
MTVKQTRCPFCHSAFYITALQLNAYRGQARCGQCHQIFDATTNLVLPASDAEPVTDLANSPAPVAAHPAQIQPETQTRHPVAVAPSEDSQLLDASLSKSQPSGSALFSDVSGVDDEKAAVSTAPSMTSASAPTVDANVSKLESEPELFSDDSGLFDDEPEERRKIWLTAGHDFLEYRQNWRSWVQRLYQEGEFVQSFNHSQLTV